MSADFKNDFPKTQTGFQIPKSGNGRWIFPETEPVLTWKIGERQPQFLAVLKLLVAQNLRKILKLKQFRIL